MTAFENRCVSLCRFGEICEDKVKCNFNGNLYAPCGRCLKFQNKLTGEK